MNVHTRRGAVLLLAALALPLAACDSGADAQPEAPARTLLVTKVSGAPTFAAQNATATIHRGLQIQGVDASERSVTLTTTATAPGTYALGTEGTQLLFAQSKFTIPAKSGSLTITDYVEGQSAKGTFTFEGTYNGMRVSFTGGTFDVKQGAN